VGGVRLLLRRLPSSTAQALRGHDLLLYAAGVTFYAAIAVVPGLLIATRLLSGVLGPAAVLSLTDDLGRALPSTLGAGDVAAGLLRRGVQLGWLAAVVSLLPATVYGEGLRRAYVALADVDDRLSGWRGRLAALPVLLLAPLLLLAVLGVTPLLNDLFGSGGWGRALGVYVALNVDWLAVSLPLAWTFRAVAPGSLGWRASLVGGLVTGAFVAGFLQGFVLFLSLPLDLGAPFGGVAGVGAAVAVLLWLWVLHLVVLVGWVATRQAVADGERRCTRPGAPPSR
jgi:membrane protein